MVFSNLKQGDTSRLLRPDIEKTFNHPLQPETIELARQEKNWQLATECLEKGIRHIHTSNLTSLDSAEQQRLGQFVEAGHKLMADADYQMPPKLRISMVGKAMMWANIVRITPHHSTDKTLEIVRQQPANHARSLFLYTPRNQMRLPLESLFQSNAFLASHWWLQMITGAGSSLVREEELAHFHELMNLDLLERYFEWPTTSDSGQLLSQSSMSTLVYMLEPKQEHAVKRVLQKKLQQIPFYSQEVFCDTKPRTLPEKPTLCLISSNLYTFHATWRTLEPLFKQLRPHFRLIWGALRKAEKWKENTRTEYFDAIYWLNEESGNKLPLESALQPLIEEKPDIILYPDLGTEMTSIVLANYRLAPRQLAAYGNPVTFGCRHIDAFLASNEIETPDNPQQYYMEPLKLLPGMAASQEERSKIVVQKYREPGRAEYCHIACPWGSVKTNPELLAFLRTLVEQSKRPIHLDLIGMETQIASYMVMKQEITALFPEGSITLCPRLEEQKYLERIGQADFALDAYPFGSYNTIFDCFKTGVPVLLREGQQVYNRFSAALFRRLGIEQYIATSENEWRKMILEAIENPAALNPYREMIERGDWQKKMIMNERELAAFIDALKGKE